MFILIFIMYKDHNSNDYINVLNIVDRVNLSVMRNKFYVCSEFQKSLLKQIILFGDFYILFFRLASLVEQRAGNYCSVFIYD